MTTYRLIPPLLELGACDTSIVHLAQQRHPTFAEAFQEVRVGRTSWIYWLRCMLDHRHCFSISEWDRLAERFVSIYDEAHIRILEQALLRVPLQLPVDVPFEVVIAAHAEDLPRILDVEGVLPHRMRTRIERALAKAPKGRRSIESLLRLIEQTDGACGARLHAALHAELDLPDLGMGTPEWYAQVSYMLYTIYYDHDMIPMYRVRGSEPLKREAAIKALAAEARGCGPSHSGTECVHVAHEHYPLSEKPDRAGILPKLIKTPYKRATSGRISAR